MRFQTYVMLSPSPQGSAQPIFNHTINKPKTKKNAKINKNDRRGAKTSSPKQQVMKEGRNRVQRRPLTREISFDPALSMALQRSKKKPNKQTSKYEKRRTRRKRETNVIVRRVTTQIKALVRFPPHGFAGGHQTVHQNHWPVHANHCGRMGQQRKKHGLAGHSSIRQCKSVRVEIGSSSMLKGVEVFFCLPSFQVDHL
jgi:hypothetical protein